MADAKAYTPRMKKLYEDSIIKAMTEKFGYKNVMQVPRLEKIVLNMGVGEATQDKKKEGSPEGGQGDCVRRECRDPSPQAEPG